MSAGLSFDGQLSSKTKMESVFRDLIAIVDHSDSDAGGHAKLNHWCDSES